MTKLERAYALRDELGLAIANYRRMVVDMELRVKKIELKKIEEKDKNKT